MSILQDILNATEGEVAFRRSQLPLDDVRAMARDAQPVRDLHAALAGRFSIIAEIKVRSPSAGEMDPANVQRAAKAYENCQSVSAVSVITQERYFGGDVGRLRNTRAVVSKPILRKDFVFTPYQVVEARAFGADAILLMASVFVGRPDGAKRLAELYDQARRLGMEALFEIGMSDHPIEQLVSIIPERARIWGVNSRHFRSSRLKLRARLGSLIGRDFTTSGARHHALRELIPAGRIAVAESGIETGAQLAELGRIGYDAALVGSSLLRSGAHVENALELLASSVAEMEKARKP